MDDTTFREHLLAWLKALSDAMIDQSRAIESLAVALQKQGRPSTLRIRVEAPQPRRRKKVRART